jgi:hypothetical protein
MSTVPIRSKGSDETMMATVAIKAPKTLMK